MSPEFINQALASEVAGNTIQAYAVAVAVFFGVVFGLWIFNAIALSRLERWAKRTVTDFDDFLVSLLRRIGPAAYLLIGLYLAIRPLALPASLTQLMRILVVLVLTVKVVQALQELVAFLLARWVKRVTADDPTAGVAFSNIGKAIQVVLWIGGALFVLDNLGVNVTSVLAGLGIGGVAMALAAQAVLGDVFSSLAIFLDKPFKVGDFIIVGDFLGTVEYIGFKTTRIRSLGGEQLIFSNSDLTGSRVRNYKRMESRRVVFQLGVTYQTTTEQVKAIPALVRDIVLEQQLARFDRAHFHKYGDFALIFEMVYYVLSPDYNLYMDVQQAINVRIKEEFERAGIEFAYPTQQLYVAQAVPANVTRDRA